jgi:hypothetical protein
LSAASATGLTGRAPSWRSCPCGTRQQQGAAPDCRTEASLSLPAVRGRSASTWWPALRLQSRTHAAGIAEGACCPAMSKTRGGLLPLACHLVNRARHARPERGARLPHDDIFGPFVCLPGAGKRSLGATAHALCCAACALCCAPLRALLHACAPRAPHSCPLGSSRPVLCRPPSYSLQAPAPPCGPSGGAAYPVGRGRHFAGRGQGWGTTVGVDRWHAMHVTVFN